MSRPSLRPLLPVSTPPDEPQIIPGGPSKKRRVTLKAGTACTSCRRRKTACDSIRPKCGTCSKKSLNCEYDRESGETPYKALRREVDVLKQQQTDLRKFLAKLKDGSKTEVESILHRLRASGDPLSIVSSYESGSIRDHRPSSPPETWMDEVGFDSAIDVRLTSRHAVVYSAPDRTSTGNLINALLDDTTQPTGAIPNPRTFVREGFSPINEPMQPLFPQSSTNQPPPWDLDELQIHIWTSVPISNRFAARVILSFLQTEHPMLGLFDADTFVKDLTDKRFEPGLCMLVNGLLAFACQTHATEDHNALAQSFEFEKEAERLWLAERLSPSSNSIAGLVLLLSSFSSHDNWKAAKFYREDLFRVAKERKLYNLADGLSDEDISKLSAGEKLATAYLAWGVYNYKNMEAIFYLNDPPLYPPSIGIDADLQHRMGSIFQAWCKLWIIINQIMLVYHSTAERGPPLGFAMTQLNALLSLSNRLPINMDLERNSSVAVLVFHIWFHIVILDLFRPFVVDRDIDELPRAINEDSISFPHAVCAASIRQLKRLTLLYQVYYEITTPTMFWHVACFYLLNYIAKSSRDPDRYLYVNLCLRAYQRFKRRFIMGNRILQGFLLMVVDLGIITIAESRAIAANNNHSPEPKVLSKTDRDSDGHKGNEGEGENERALVFILDLDKGIHDQTSSRVDVMAEGFQNIQLFDQFTEGLV